MAPFLSVGHPSRMIVPRIVSLKTECPADADSRATYQCHPFHQFHRRGRVSHEIRHDRPSPIFRTPATDARTPKRRIDLGPAHRHVCVLGRRVNRRFVSPTYSIHTVRSMKSIGNPTGTAESPFQRFFARDESQSDRHKFPSAWRSPVGSTAKSRWAAPRPHHIP